VSKLIEALKNLEQTVLPGLLQQPKIWGSKDITYHPPHVERLFCDVENTNYRLNLHLIHPCDPAKALLHPHSSPNAIHVIEAGSGIYQMGIGFLENGQLPDRDKLAILEVTGGFYYEMAEPNQCHYVCPMTVPSFSVTLIEKTEFPNSLAPKSPIKLGPLEERRVEYLRRVFRIHFPSR
jgi:hypothetical protein